MRQDGPVSTRLARLDSGLPPAVAPDQHSTSAPHLHRRQQLVTPIRLVQELLQQLHSRGKGQRAQDG